MIKSATLALLFSVLTVSTNAREALRKANRLTPEDPSSLIKCQLGTVHTTYETNVDEFIQEEETTCTLVEDGVPSLCTHPVVLPSKFAEKYYREIQDGMLVVSIRGATLTAGEFVVEDVSQLTIIDDNFSPINTGRGLLEAKDPRDAFGERRLIAFRVNGVAGERQVRLFIMSLSV